MMEEYLEVPGYGFPMIYFDGWVVCSTLCQRRHPYTEKGLIPRHVRYPRIETVRVFSEKSEIWAFVRNNVLAF